MASKPKPKEKFLGKGFEKLPRATIQNIKSADALAIWTLVKSRPDDWVVRKKQVQKDLGLSDARYRKGVNRLRELGLWKTEFIQGENGRLQGRRTVVHNQIDYQASSLQTKETKAPQKNTETQEEIENKIGIKFPAHISNLDAPNRVAAIIQRAKLPTESTRIVFAEFSACCERKKVDDPWALLASLVRKASHNELRLSADGERRLPPWV